MTLVMRDTMLSHLLQCLNFKLTCLAFESLVAVVGDRRRNERSP